MFPAVIIGDGFRLRALRQTDASAIHAYLRRPEVYEATSAGRWDLRAVRAFIRANEEGMDEGRWCRYAILLDNDTEAVGDVGLTATDRPNGRAEIGYHLDPGYWNRGMMTRAAGLLVDWAFTNGFHRIEATVMEGNARSARVLEKLGFTREAMLREYKLVRGEYRDFALWALLEGDRPA